MTELSAALDIGAGAIRMSVGQIAGRSLKIIETLTYPLRIGKDTFTDRTISAETMNEAIRILEGFKLKMQEYNIGSYRAVATSAIREAENQEFFLEQVKNRTGIKIEIIEKSEEVRLIFEGLQRKIRNFSILLQKGVMFAKIGSGNAEIALMKKNEMYFSRSLPLGGLRIREILKDVPEDDLAETLEDFIESDLKMLAQGIPKLRIEQIIATGHLLNMIMTCCSSGAGTTLSYETLKDFYGKIKNQSLSGIQKAYNLAAEQSDLLLPAVYTYLKFLEMTGARSLMWIDLSFTETLLLSKTSVLKDRLLSKNMLNMALKTGEKFQFDKTHAVQVADISAKIFNALKALHGLNNKAGLLLRFAALWHDIGIFIQNSGHHKHSFYLISNLEIPGLSQKEIRMIALIARYHRKNIPRKYHPEYAALKTSEKVIVSKLSAILRIADALDRSHRQHLKTLKIENAGNSVLLKAGFGGNTSWLEKLYFGKKSDLFRQIFGIKIELIEVFA